jgi:hypothetical protein
VHRDQFQLFPRQRMERMSYTEALGNIFTSACS